MILGERKNVLITGGTSGLGKSILKQLITDGYKVVTIGRREPAFVEEIPFFNCDFSDLANIPKVVESFKTGRMKFDILINNAGILSTPDYQLTQNGFELSYQINFLSHVLLTRVLLKTKILNPKLIVNISSPIYKMGKIYSDTQTAKDDHGMFQTYSNTKLYMALFSRKLSEEGFSSFSFNPGTFRSGIYRSQKKWFQNVYKIAAPFMTSSKKVANGLCKTINTKNGFDGQMIDKRGKYIDLVPDFDGKLNDFWSSVEGQTADFM